MHALQGHGISLILHLFCSCNLIPFHFLFQSRKSKFVCFPVHIICDKPKCIFPAVENSKLSADYCILYLPCTFSVIRDIRNPARCPIQAKQCLSLMKDRIGFSKGDQSFHKSKQIFITFLSSPVQPCGLIVLTIHIVIPILCVSKLISRQNAWCSLRKQK